MGDDVVRYPGIVDTDALIAVANTSLWSRITNTLQLTTTNVCLHELKRHLRDRSEYASEGTRDNWIYTGSQRAVDVFEDDTNDSFTVVSCVPRPHGEDAGEQSLATEIKQHPGQYRFAILMDSDGRRSINRLFDSTDEPGRAVAPTFLLYLLLDSDACTIEEFCQACGELLRGEGWTGYQAVQAAWAAIPVDCSPYLSADVLPE